MISKICYYIGKIPKDKILHYFISYLILDICLSIGYNYILYNWLNIIISIFIVSIFIFLKEIIDKNKYNNWDWKDILFSYFGVITKLIIFII